MNSKNARALRPKDKVTWYGPGDPVEGEVVAYGNLTLVVAWKDGHHETLNHSEMADVTAAPRKR